MDTPLSVIDLKSTFYGSLSSGILKSHSFLSYSTGVNKTLAIRAPATAEIVASIRLLDLRPGCLDKLTLSDENYPYKTVMYCNTWTIPHRERDTDELKTFSAKSGKLLVRFDTARGTSISYGGFQLTFTATSSIPCRYDEFRCTNNRCISQILRCDGHNHCGDGSDQRNCGSNIPPNLGRNPGRVAGIIIGVVFLLIAAVCGVYVMIRRSQRTTQVETTVIHPPSYPTNQPGTCYPPPPPYTAYPQGQVNPGYR